MQLKTLQIFMDVMKRGCMARVAKDRGVDPSTISREVSRLERELGVALFEGPCNQQRPTEAALIYLEKVELIVQDLHEARECARGASGILEGRLKLALPERLGSDWLMPFLPAWRKRYPAIQLEFVSGILEDADATVFVGKGGGKRFVTDVRYRLCASPEYAQNHPMTDPQELSGKECVLERFDQRPHLYFYTRHGDRRKVAVKGGLAVVSESGRREAALAGAGPTLLTQWTALRCLRRGDLVELFPNWEPIPKPDPDGVWLSTTYQRHGKARLKALETFLLESLRAEEFQERWRDLRPVPVEEQDHAA